MHQCPEKPTIERGGTYESNQSDPGFADLLNNALCCAIRAHIDDPVVGPSKIEETTYGLQKIICKKEKLSEK